MDQTQANLCGRDDGRDEGGDGGRDASRDGGADKGAEGGGDWRAAIADDRVRRFADRFASPAEAARAAFDLRRKLSNAVVVPDHDAPAEAVAEFRRRLGVPDAPDGYDVVLPDDLPAELAPDADGKKRLGRFLGAMHAAGAAPAAVQAAVDVYYDMVREAWAARAGQARQSRAEIEAALAREWGADYEGNVNAARRAARAFGGDGFTRFLDDTVVDGRTLGDHPELLRAFAAAGRRLGEDGFHAGAEGGERLTLQERIDRIHGWQFSADPGERERYRSASVQGELARLYDQLHGDGPVVGADGRAL